MAFSVQKKHADKESLLRAQILKLLLLYFHIILPVLFFFLL